MEDTLSKANKAYPDCSAMASKLRAMTQNTEEQLRAQRSQASYLIHLAANTFPKGLHCLSMRLTAEYFTLMPEDRQLPNGNKVRNRDLYHLAIFSDNILATAVAVNSTIASSRVRVTVGSLQLSHYYHFICLLMLQCYLWHCSAILCCHHYSMVCLLNWKYLSNNLT